MHWSGGGIGYFPTYALGNVISLQIWAKVREALPDLDDQMAAGDLCELSDWLRDNLYALGRKLTPKETLARLTGSDAIDPQPYLAYLGDKMAALRRAEARDAWSHSSARTGVLDDVTDRVLAELPAGAVLFDAHTHLGDDIDGMRGRPDEMLAMFDRVGITGSFTFCLDEPDREPAFTAANDRTLAYADERSRPDRPVRPARSRGAPARGGVRCLDLGARGIKLHPRAQKFSVGDERLDAVFALAVERDVPILIHGGRGLPPIGDHLAALVDRYADVRLIIAHAGIADLGGLAGHFAQVPGVFFDTSLWSVVDLLDLMRQVAPAADPLRDGLPLWPASRTRCCSRSARHAFAASTRPRFAACSARRRSRSRTATPLPELTPPRGPDAITQPAAAGPHPPVHLDGDAAALDAPARRGRRARPRAQRGARGQRRRRAGRRSDPRARCRSQRSSGPGSARSTTARVRARARPARMLVHIADILAVTAPACPTASPVSRPRSRQPSPARRASTSTFRFQALCGCPGSPASGSAGSSARGMFATPAATSVIVAAPRAAATETSGNENACRSPARRYADASGGAGSRTAATISPASSTTSERLSVGRPAVELEQRQLALAVGRAHDDGCAAGGEGRREVGGVGGDAVARLEVVLAMVADLGISTCRHRRASSPFLSAVVPAARVLAQVAPEGALVAQQRGGRQAGSGRDRRVRRDQLDRASSASVAIAPIRTPSPSGSIPPSPAACRSTRSAGARRPRSICPARSVPPASTATPSRASSSSASSTDAGRA